MSDNESLSPIERPLPQRISSISPATLELEAQGSESHFTFAAFWHIIVKRIVTIATATLLVLVLTGIYTFKMAPVFRATATMEVETDYPQLQSITDVYRQAPVGDISFLTTEMQVLQSDNLAWTTIQQLGLDRDVTLTSRVKVPGQSSARVLTARKTAMIAEFKDGLSVEPLKDSTILAVSYECGNPDMAAEVVNHLISNFRDFNFQERYDFTQRASSGMERQLEDLKMKVERSQQALVDYERQNLIVNVGDKQTINDERLEQLNKDFTQAMSDRVQKESLYQLARGNEGQVGILMQDEVLQRLEEKYNDLKASYADAQGQYGPNFPKVVRLRDQLTQLQSLMESARKQAVEKVHNDYIAAVSRENLLGDALTKAKADVSVVNQRMIEHNILKRDFEINQQLYESLLQTVERCYALSQYASHQCSHYRSSDSAGEAYPPESAPQYGRGLDGWFDSWDYPGLCAGSS